ncbi:hypothetical protein DSO57_1018554 [Entomophthora muscae]|uniref:Uncharacterized protein n=1 Tax=Entomophthora muscae TaxID=34485 RepID=A0ACC2STP3_9FUNG|nr:hypothetical protein DSO57_1018554 [Entomophthora muscae]
MRASMILAQLGFGFAAQTICQDGINLIEHFETYQPNFYYDQAGVRTIGFGHACIVSSNYCNDIIAPLSRQQATDLMMNDIAPCAQYVTDAITSNVSTNAFAAMVSLAYNVGPQAFGASQIPAAVNSGNLVAASNGFMAFTTVNGQYLTDLAIRRQAEMKLFCSDGFC